MEFAKVNICNPRQKELQKSRWLDTEALQVILHYPNQGDGKHAVDPWCGKYMKGRSQIYVRACWGFCQKLLQNSKEIVLGKLWHPQAR